jgi:hypothetical protein
VDGTTTTDAGTAGVKEQYMINGRERIGGPVHPQE